MSPTRTCRDSVAGSSSSLRSSPGLLYGPLVYRFAREARGHGVPEVMVAVARNGGRIRPQVAVVKAIASALCIGGGGSVGREGPIVQIGSALGSTLAQLVKLDERRIRLLVACGAAGGIAATFNAPLAGVFFAMETHPAAVGDRVVRDGRAVLGHRERDRPLDPRQHPFLTLPTFHVDHVVQYPLFAAARRGRRSGRGRRSPGSCTRSRTPVTGPGADRNGSAPPSAGCCSVALLLVLPEMYGVGYPVLGQSRRRRLRASRSCSRCWSASSWPAASPSASAAPAGCSRPACSAARCSAPCSATSSTPSLPPTGGSLGAYALVGMGAVFAGAARAPITAVVILFELTGEYTIILPLMLAIVARDRGQPPRLARHRLHPQTPAPRHRHRRTRRRRPAPPTGHRSSWPSHPTRCAVDARSARSRPDDSPPPAKATCPSSTPRPLPRHARRPRRHGRSGSRRGHRPSPRSPQRAEPVNRRRPDRRRPATDLTTATVPWRSPPPTDNLLGWIRHRDILTALTRTAGSRTV